MTPIVCQDARAQYEQLTASFENENRLCANLAAELKVSQSDLRQLEGQAAGEKRALEGYLAQERARADGLAGKLAAALAENGELRDQNQALNAQVTTFTHPLFRSPCLFGHAQTFGSESGHSCWGEGLRGDGGGGGNILSRLRLP